jgi:hypothetical protein
LLVDVEWALLIGWHCNAAGAATNSATTVGKSGRGARCGPCCSCGPPSEAAQEKVLAVMERRVGAQRDPGTFQRAVADMADKLRDAHGPNVHDWPL